MSIRISNENLMNDFIGVQISQIPLIMNYSTGVFALYQLGLTTQIPLNLVYLTDGAPRDIDIGKRKIKFKKTVPKSFAIKDPLLHLIVQAFKEIGQKKANPSFLDKMQKPILKLDRKDLDSQLRFAPVWIQKQIINLYNQK